MSIVYSLSTSFIHSYMEYDGWYAIAVKNTEIINIFAAAHFYFSTWKTFTKTKGAIHHHFPGDAPLSVTNSGKKWPGCHRGNSETK